MLAGIGKSETDRGPVASPRAVNIELDHLDAVVGHQLRRPAYRETMVPAAMSTR